MPRAGMMVSVCALRRKLEAYRPLAVLFVAVVGVWMLALLMLPPRTFPSEAVLRIAHGASAKTLAQTLEEKGALVHHSLLIVSLFLVGGSDSAVKAGTYAFSVPLGPLALAWRFTRGIFAAPSVRVTIPEGLASYEIADILAQALPDFSKERFIRLGRAHEGYLFPDTYDFSIFATPEEIIATMRKNFDRRVAPLRERYQLNEGTLRRAVIIASLLEKEARTSRDRRLIAGIIENRLRAGMPLQIDAVFGYILQRSTFHPRGEVLDVNSPYNTYRVLGLPPGPIGNPGLAALEDALNPTPSHYLYYLVDHNGIVHYSVTFEEHVGKKLRYLNP